MKFYNITLEDTEQDIINTVLSNATTKYMATSIILGTRERVFQSANSFSRLKSLIKQLNAVSELVDIIIYQVASGRGRLFAAGRHNNLLEIKPGSNVLI